MNTSRSKWFRHGFLNTIEHGLTRTADAVISIVLLSVLSSGDFAKLAVAQAWVAPLLLLFVQPETVIYRDFQQWKSDGAQAFSDRLHAFRMFSFAKALIALLVSIVSAFLLPISQELSFLHRLSLMVWAFTLVLAPQLSGADREYLRLELRLKELNLISLYQKMILLLGTALVAIRFPTRFDLLAGVAVFSTITSVLLARHQVLLVLPPVSRRSEVAKPVLNAVRSFTIWQHISGVLLNWVLTMDVYFLGLLMTRTFDSDAEIGRYAVSLKLANFAMALPLALANFFLIWINQRESVGTPVAEYSKIKKLSLRLFGVTLTQGILLVNVAPLALSVLSRDRWSADEQNQMFRWMLWITAGGVVLFSHFLLTFWLSFRGDVYQLMKRVYIPWAVGSAILYSSMVHFSPFGSQTNSAAVSNLMVSLLFASMIWIYLRKLRRVD